MARSHTASDQLVERLIEWGIDTVFGLPGDGINGVMESLRTHEDQIRFVHVRHEETAALAAAACVCGPRRRRQAPGLNVADRAVRSARGARGPAATASPIATQSRDAVTGDRSIKNVAGHSAVAALDGRRLPPRERIEQAARLL